MCLRKLLGARTDMRHCDRDIDYSMFVLNVDLWNPECTEEVNLCRNTTSTGTPAISATPGYAYPPSNGGDPTSMRYAPPAMPPSRDMGYAQQPPPMNYVQDYQVSAPYAQGRLRYRECPWKPLADRL